MTNSQSPDIASLEALLFMSGDPLPIEQIAVLLDCSKQEAQTTVKALQQQYENGGDRGLRIMVHDEEIQLVTHPRTTDIIERFQESTLREALTPAALETLAVIAYRGPLPKSEIESVRGVNCSSILRTLLLRGLVTRDRSEEDARTFLYRISAKFLQTLGLSSLDELPSFESLQ